MSIILSALLLRHQYSGHLCASKSNLEAQKCVNIGVLSMGDIPVLMAVVASESFNFIIFPVVCCLIFNVNVRIFYMVFVVYC